MTTQGGNALAIVTEEAGGEVVSFCNVCRSESIETVDAEFHLCRCLECGYVFDNPRPSRKEVAAFYSQKGKYDAWLKDEHARDELWKRRVRKLLPFRVAGNLLDIGTGTGQFLHHAQPYFTAIAGTEVSSSAISIARKKYGIELFHGEASELNSAPGSFDNITLFHVLEHVHDPAALIARCNMLLRDGGALFIAVPNDVLAWSSAIKKAGRKVGLAAFQKFSPVLGISRAGTSREIHLSHFTPTVLRRLVETSGFSVIEESLDPYYVSTGLQLLIDRCYAALHRTLYGALKINRYDTIWMVARKP